MRSVHFRLASEVPSRCARCFPTEARKGMKCIGTMDIWRDLSMLEAFAMPMPSLLQCCTREQYATCSFLQQLNFQTMLNEHDWQQLILREGHGANEQPATTCALQSSSGRCASCLRHCSMDNAVRSCLLAFLSPYL